MSKFQDGLRYYLLVAGLGLLVSSITVAFYLLYMTFWGFTESVINYSILLFIPLAFLSIGVPYALVKLFAQTKTTESGTHAVLEAYHLTNGNIELRDTAVKPAAAMLTIGLGGSAGPEGPSLLAGGGIAAALSRHFKIKADVRRRVFIAGAAAGLAATFHTPLTAILFALEIPYKNDLDRETFMEAVVASVPAYLLSVTILGSEPFFGPIPSMPITLYEIGLSMLLGLICGLYTLFFIKSFSWVHHLSYKVRRRLGNLGLVLIGGTILSVSGVLSVYSIGIGFHFVSALIQGTSFSLAVLILIVLLKTFATATTLSFGGSGGLFFPTIVIGAGIGYIFATFFDVQVTGVMFMAVGMASLLAGTHKVLLTPVAFVIETLGGVFAIPALLASVVSYALSGKHSFYSVQPHARLKTEELAVERFFAKGQRLIPEKLYQTKAKEVMTTKPVTLHHGTTVKSALETFEGTKLRVLPVIDDDGCVIGVVNLEDLGFADMRRQSMTLSEAVTHKPVLICEETSLEEIAQLMMDTQQDHVFVVDATERLTGVVSGIDVVKKILELLAT
jgi:CIC family chloride channel protein